MAAFEFATAKAATPLLGLLAGHGRRGWADQTGSSLLRGVRRTLAVSLLAACVSVATIATTPANAAGPLTDHVDLFDQFDSTFRYLDEQVLVPWIKASADDYSSDKSGAPMQVSPSAPSRGVADVAADTVIGIVTAFVFHLASCFLGICM